MSQNTRNMNPVGFLNDARQLSHRRAAAYGSKRPHHVPLAVIPPFQIFRGRDDAGISSISLIREVDNVAVSILTDLQSTGLQIIDLGDLIIWAYPGTIAIPTIVQAGHHNMTITDSAGKKWYRETWCWKPLDTMFDYVRMEWFHQKNFLNFNAGGTINFEPPFKFWYYFPTELGKPSYQYERDVDERNGIEYVNKIVSWKEQRFVCRADENMIDALSYVPHMHCVNVDFLGDRIEAFRVVVTPEWEERGDDALVEIEIRSNQVVATFGDALAAKDYEINPGECVAVNFMAVCQVLNGSAGHIGFFCADGTPFTTNDFVLVKSSNAFNATISLFQYTGSGYGPAIVPATGQIVFNEETGAYLVYSGATSKWTLPKITNIATPSLSSYTVFAIGFPEGINEIWGKNGTVETRLATATSAELLAGVTFNPVGNGQFQIRVNTWKCGEIAKSAWAVVAISGGGDPTFEGERGIGFMEIESNFIIGDGDPSS